MVNILTANGIIAPPQSVATLQTQSAATASANPPPTPSVPNIVDPITVTNQSPFPPNTAEEIQNMTTTINSSPTSLSANSVPASTSPAYTGNSTNNQGTPAYSFSYPMDVKAGSMPYVQFQAVDYRHAIDISVNGDAVGSALNSLVGLVSSAAATITGIDPTLLAQSAVATATASGAVPSGGDTLSNAITNVANNVGQLVSVSNASASVKSIGNIYFMMPAHPTTETKPQWESKDNTLGAGLMQFQRWMNGTSSGQETVLGDITGGVLNRLGESLLDSSIAKIGNPRKQMLFKGMDHRSFDFEFNMFPRNAQDCGNIANIIAFFKRNSSASTTPDQIMLTFPAEWKITYYLADGSLNKYIPQIDYAVCTACNVNYNSEEIWSMYNSGMAFNVKLSLSFTETHIVTAEQILNIDDAGVSY